MINNTRHIRLLGYAIGAAALILQLSALLFAASGHVNEHPVASLPEARCLDTRTVEVIGISARHTRDGGWL